MYLTPTDKHWVIDIEGDGLLQDVSRIWCCVCINAKTDEVVRLVGEAAVREWVDARVDEDCFFIAHNGLGYDASALNKVLKTRIRIHKVIDTLVLSMLYHPSLPGGHGLSDWGARFKKPKGDYKDFSHYTDEMLQYCEQDTRICKLTYLYLCRKMTEIGFTEQSCALEHLSWFGIKQQQRNGFWFNIEEAITLYATVREWEQELTEEVHKHWPPKLVKVKTYKKAFKQDGSRTKAFESHLEEYPKITINRRTGEYYAYDYVAFNIGSPSQRVTKLLELGWVPEEFTKVTKKGGGGNPKVTDSGQLVPSLVRFIESTGNEQVKLIANWIDVNARANMINTWIEAYNDETHRIHGSLWLANTLRYKHSGPNTANIPGVREGQDDKPLMGRQGVFTYEARALWGVADRSRRLIGVDAKGIQLRILAHYLNNTAFTEAILSDDPHAANRDAWGFEEGKTGRALAKTIVYATLMGAGDARIASEAAIPLKDAKDAKALFMDRLPEFPDLVRRLKAEFNKTGRITLIDGSKIIVSQEYMVIPYLLQGDESRIMRQSYLNAYADVRRKKLDVIKVGDIHDEWQNDSHKDHAEEFAYEVCPKAFLRTGELFNYNLPIECDARIGTNWAETH